MPRPKAIVPKFSLSRRNGTFYVGWWEDGRARRASCRTSDHEEARQFLAAFIATRNEIPVPELPTIGDILDGYEADRQEHVGPTLRYACAAVRSVLGDLTPDLLSRQQIKRYALERRHAAAARHKERYGKPGRPLSDGTIIRELVTLRAAMRWAIGARWITSEPVIEVPAAPQPRDRWLTRAEAGRLVDAAKAPHVRLFILLGLYTGARAGALLELQWDQVDFAANRIALGRGRGNKRRAVVPMPLELASALRTAQRAAIGDFVISIDGSQIASIKTGFNAAAHRARLSGVTPHTLRHTAASWMIQRGVPFGEVAAFLGNSVAMIERVYGHQHPDHLKGAAAALSGAFPRQLDEETF